MRTIRPIFLPIAAAALGLAVAGCSGKTDTLDSSAVPFEVTTYTPDLREHRTSWGHTGRGGAALRKPSYQPVLGSPETLEARSGKLYPELQIAHPGNQATVEVPAGLISSKCASPNLIASRDVVQVFPQPAADALKQITTLANDKGSVSDYIRVRDKLCQGVSRLTYAEWEILVEGTPKELPLPLQHKPSNRQP